MPLTSSYNEIIMKYHPEILCAKYHFVSSHVGWQLEIKECVQNGQKQTKSAKYALSIVLLCVDMDQ